MFGIGHI